MYKALLLGALNSPVPKPSSTRKAATCHAVASTDTVVSASIPMTWRAMPAEASQREPRRSDSQPVSGDRNMTVAGWAAWMKPAWPAGRPSSRWSRKGKSSRRFACERKPNQAVPTAAVTPRLRNRASCTVGCATRRWTSRNAPPATPANTSSPPAEAAVQPTSGPRLRPSTRQTTVTIRSAAPTGSGRWPG